MKRLAITLCLYLAAGQAAAASYAVANSVGGECFYFKDNRWEPIAKANKIPYGTLLRFEKNSQVEFQIGNTKQRIKIKAGRAMITRLSTDALKKYRIDGYMLAQHEKLGRKSNRQKAFVRSLSQAWSKLKLVFVYTGGEAAKSKASAGNNLAARTDTPPQAMLELITPVDGASLLVPNENKFLPVSWNAKQNAEVGLEYEVIVWKPNKTEPVAQFKTKETFAWLPVSESGQYYVRVYADDPKVFSRAHLFEVIR